MLRKVQQFTSQAEFDPERFKCCSAALYYMAEWMLAVELECMKRQSEATYEASSKREDV